MLLVCSHPQTGEAWWMHVQGWFSDPAHRASGRIDFDKRTQRFDADAAQRLLNLADPHGRAHVPAAEHREETLTSNLLTVTIPDLVYRTPTQLQDPREIYERQREAGDDGPRMTSSATAASSTPGCRRRTRRWPAPCPAPPIKVSTADLAASSRSPRSSACSCSCSTSRSARTSPPTATGTTGRKFVYFRATADLAPRKIRSASGRQRLVFNPKYKKSAPDRDQVLPARRAGMAVPARRRPVAVRARPPPTTTPATGTGSRCTPRSCCRASSGSNATRRSTTRPGCGPPTCTAGTGNPVPARGDPRVRVPRDLHRRPGHR